mgnify:CR=1 FL=1|tara:strand:+ start:41 stop:319 length:279 start_codon:yes stop_codon:yes gene_type:complete
MSYEIDRLKESIEAQKAKAEESSSELESVRDDLNTAERAVESLQDQINEDVTALEELLDTLSTIDDTIRNTADHIDDADMCGSAADALDRYA